MAEFVDRRIGRLGKPRFLVLGMDPGISSCGFALLDLANEEILEMGVRLFNSPVNPKNKLSLATERRGYRGARRNIDRTQDRLKHCLRLMKRCKLVPEDADKEYFHTVAGDKPPLILRLEGLDRLLSEREWALVLYSLCKRRGYIPHGTGSKGSDADEGKVLSALRKNADEMDAVGARTVGEWLAGLDASRNHAGKYDKCVSHASLKDEVVKLFDAQRSFGSSFASREILDEYLEIFDWERSTADFDKHVYEETVGRCAIFLEEKRAARCTLTSEMVAAYGALGNITIMRDGAVVGGLSAEMRNACMDMLFSTCPAAKKTPAQVKYSALRKMMDLESSEYFKGVAVEEESKREVYEPKGWRELRSTLLKEHEDLLRRLRDDRDLADAVMEAAAYSSSRAVLQNRLEGLGLLGKEDVEALCGLPFASRALNGYGARSKKALDILYDAFQDDEVLTLTQAEQESGLAGYKESKSKVERKEKLVPYLDWAKAVGRVNTNPVVIRALSQMRKVVNAITRKWGVPHEIHVEVARELSLPKKARAEIEKADKKNAAERKRIASEIAELKGCSAGEVKGKLIEKYRLYEEQGCFDLYTGDPIDLSRMLSDETYTQIDHVLPFSRTGDNSKNNKVLVLSSSNQNKRDRSPYEWMNSGESNAPDWDEYVERVQNNKKLRRRKKDNLLEQDLASKEAEFQERNLNDTRYMSREVARYLDDCLLFPENGPKSHIVAVTGQATAWLRRRWGLNYGMDGEKDRLDDRHHAFDACVIAAISRGLVIKTARISQKTHWSVTPGMTAEERKRARNEALQDTMPWPSFASDVDRRRDSIVPTRFVPRKGKGELFEQTVYSYIGLDEKGRHLARKAGLKRGGQAKPVVVGNASVSDDGKSLVKVGDMICLRLWHDPHAKRREDGVGRWYADPIYKADIPALKNGTYVPRIAKQGYGRDAWEPVPVGAMREDPVLVYLGDLVKVGSEMARYDGYNIATANWSFVDPLSREPKPMPSVGSLDNESIPEIIRESIV